MTGLLRELASRPILERQRSTAFAAMTAAVVISAAALVATAPDRHPRPARPAPQPALASPPVAPSSANAPRPQRGGPAPQPTRTPSTVARAGRQFITGYLAYLSGRESAQDIASATPALRRRLRAHPPRISSATRQRHPRLGQIVARRRRVGSWNVTATIVDAGVRYRLALVVAQRRRVALVAHVGER